ncbi:hypothetical protein BVG19_g2843 [[Candida] boidinii]|nr:hypothetical protein BVG19_g2843 [[Candida] boidinii]OWB48571.1 hypothetical protein B5S27_g106 [[Candida] boidinii]
MACRANIRAIFRGLNHTGINGTSLRPVNRFNNCNTITRSFQTSSVARNELKKQTEKPSDEQSKDETNKEQKPFFSSDFVQKTAVAFLGALIGATYVSYQVASEPPEFLFPSSSTTQLSKVIPPTYGKPQKAVDEITALLGPNKVNDVQSNLDAHSDTYWQTEHPTPEQRPQLVVYPESTEEVSEVLKICHKHKVPVIPFSGGTSLEGHFIPTRGGICVDISRMNKIIKLNETDLDVTVQGGLGWEELRDYLSDYNLLYSPDPGPSATIAGGLANSCSGTNAARYGTAKENVLSITVVLADGTIIKTKKRARKSAAGYNLTGLFVGSEGTLGIITEATLKLWTKPKFENIAVISFPSIADAASTVTSIVQHGIYANALELLDGTMMRFIDESGETTAKYDINPTLMLKLGGDSKDTVKLLTNSVKKICSENNSKTFRFAETEEEKEELWTARKVALWSTINWGKANIDPEINVWTTDVAVPISNFVKTISETQDDIKQSGLISSIVGHAGDGNFHALILYKHEDYQKCRDLVQRMVDRALIHEGTCTGEHGVGYGKRGYLEEEVGEDTIALMRKIKFALDPERILNPDKIFKIDPNDHEP